MANVNVKVNELICTSCWQKGLQFEFHRPSFDEEATLHFDPGKMGEPGVTINHFQDFDDFDMAQVINRSLVCPHCQNVYSMTEAKHLYEQTLAINSGLINIPPGEPWEIY